jgi:adenosylhomocysteine nucleosidase
MRPRLGSIVFFAVVLSGTLLSGIGRSVAASEIDATSRTAVISAYPPEWKELQAALKNRNSQIVNGTEYVTGEIEGKPVLLFLSGISMINAAMTTQFVLDHFSIDRIVFSGVAGGLNPDLKLGDVVVPGQWSEYLEAIFARDTGSGYTLPKFAGPPQNGNYGLIFPQPVQIARAPDDPEDRVWFTVDPQLIALVRTVSNSVQLNNCTADRKCVDHQPRIIIGGNGVSGQAFVDNSNFRDYAHRAFNADAADQESAAAAHVAYANKVPFIAFRSLSDLAGGEPGESLFDAFQDLAAGNSALLVRALLKALP